MINSRVMVTMQNIQTFRTGELPLTERHINNSSASVAPLAASSGFGVLQQLATAYDSFVCQHTVKSSPASIEYMLGKNMISDHVLDIKVLSCNYSVSDCEAFAHFMEEVAPLIKDFKMLPCDLNPCLFPVIGSPNPLGHNSLEFGKLLFGFDIEPGICNWFSFIIGQEVFNADINSNSFFRGIDSTAVRQFTGKDSKPLVCFVYFDGHGLDFAFGNSVQDNRNVADFGGIEFFIIDEPKTTSFTYTINTLRVCYAINPAFESWIAGFDFNAFLTKLNPVKEVVKGFAQPVRNILKDLGIGLCVVLRAGGFDILDKRIHVKLSGCHEFFVKIKKSVVDFPANLKLLNQSNLLLGRRVNPEFVH